MFKKFTGGLAVIYVILHGVNVAWVGCKIEKITLLCQFMQIIQGKGVEMQKGKKTVPGVHICQCQWFAWLGTWHHGRISACLSCPTTRFLWVWTTYPPGFKVNRCFIYTAFLLTVELTLSRLVLWLVRIPSLNNSCSLTALTRRFYVWIRVRWVFYVHLG